MKQFDINQEMDWQEYRRPLLSQSWYPLNTGAASKELIKHFDPSAFGSPINKVSLGGRSIIHNDRNKQIWPEVKIHGVLKNSFLENPVNVIQESFLCELENVHVILPYGVMWSEMHNEIYFETSLHGNIRCSYFFYQSELTKWKILKGRWFPQPIIVNEPIYWAYEPQFTNIFHYILDNYWKLLKMYFYESKSIIPPGIDYFSAPTKNSSYVQQLIKINQKPLNHRYFPWGHYFFKKLYVPWIKSSFSINDGVAEGFHHRCFNSSYFNELTMLVHGKGNQGFAPKPKLMVLREDAFSRKIVNINEVKNVLTEFGYQSYNPSHFELQDQVKTFNTASHVIGVHGAALANMIWTQNSTKLLELMPIKHQDLGYRGICGSKGINHHIFPVHSFDNEINLRKSPPNQDVIVDIELLRVAVKKFEGA